MNWWPCVKCWMISTMNQANIMLIVLKRTKKHGLRLLRSNSDDGPHLAPYWIFVDKDTQAQGLGTRLLHFLRLRLKKPGDDYC